jgi:hypothetical protein
MLTYHLSTLSRCRLYWDLPETSEASPLAPLCVGNVMTTKLHKGQEPRMVHVADPAQTRVYFAGGTEHLFLSRAVQEFMAEWVQLGQGV